MFSDKLNKINKYGFSQERNILVTNKGVYNLKKKELKRRIDINTLKGITASKFNDEFVLHGNDLEYDYYFISPRKKIIVQIIDEAYFALKQTHILFCLLEEKNLKKVVTLKDEKKKDLSFTRMSQVNLSDICQFYAPPPENRQSRSSVLLQPSDFRSIAIIGRGSFSKVTLVEYLKTKEPFAIKSLRKDVILDHDQIDNLLLEKKILEELEHPFLVNMAFSYQTDERINFVLPYLPGGELFTYFRTSKSFDEEKARFYTSQVALAINHLHGYGIVYRDIKLENILIGEDGYIKIVDFGLSKKIKDGERTFSLCGTPEYLSPEVISGVGHGKSTDWWALGIIM